MLARAHIKKSASLCIFDDNRVARHPRQHVGARPHFQYTKQSLSLARTRAPQPKGWGGAARFSARAAPPTQMNDQPNGQPGMTHA